MFSNVFKAEIAEGAFSGTWDNIIDRFMFWGLCATFFLIPVATSPAVITSSFVLALWVFSGKFFKEREKLKGQKWVLPVLLFVAMAFAGLIYTNDFDTGLKFARKTHYWVLAFAAATVYVSAGRASVLMRCYAAGVTLTSALFLLQSMGIVPMRPPYSVGLLNKWAHISFSLMNTFGIVVLSWFFRVAASRQEKALYSVLMLINFVALSILLSDSGHLAFILLSPIIAYNLLDKKNPAIIILVSILLTGAMFLSPVTQQRLFQTVDQTDSYMEGEVVTQVGMRYYMWTGALKLFLENPFLGVGTGGYQSELNEIKPAENIPDPIQPHNSFLYMAVSFGIPGVIVLVWLFWVLLKKGWRARDSLVGFSTLSFTLVLIIGSLTDTQILQVHTATLFAVFTGLQGSPDG